MGEILNIFIGIIVLALGIPLGNFLAKSTEEELKDGRKWFKTIILVSIVLSAISAVFKKDSFLFTFLFIAIVTSRSLRK